MSVRRANALNAFSCLSELLRHHAHETQDAPAILAPGRPPLTYARLHRHVEDIGRALRAAGIGPDDRVVVMLPNGPEVAVAILSVAVFATCASVNPGYAADELDRYFADLRPRAVIAQAGLDSAARQVARAHGIPFLELSPMLDAEAGLFTFAGQDATGPPATPAVADKVALLLLTSGTTSRPKIVPLTHANICSSAWSSATALALSGADRCLNVLPFFHGHGLFATLLASLTAGGSVVCTPGCDVNRFFAWLSEFRPTWYSAVPTMHQAILAQARHHRAPASACRLRLVRSASAPLPPPVLAELERTFETCVIEFYGMTETASSPIACNPLPPRQRKPGSVGIPVGLDVAIMDEAGALLARGETGQIVVRGPSVMAGYDGDPAATQAAFAGPWFKTGDQGFFDDDGYLFLAGRRQEIINRGGEKVAPREVDEALLEHPAVAEAVTFAVAHATLGEDVAAAIVLRPDAKATPMDIRRFVTGRIADFKVPRQVLLLDSLPKSPTGKVQRVGLAAKLAAGAARPERFVAARTSLEARLAECYAHVLQVERVGIHDDFFAMGGDSLLAAHLLTEIHKRLHLDIEVSAAFEAPTVAEMAHHIDMRRQARAESSSSPIELAPRAVDIEASFAQERVWELQEMLPGAPFFNVLHALRLRPPFDRGLLEQSLNEVVRRHEILRTAFRAVEGRLMQIVAPQVTVPLRFDDLHELPAARREKIARGLVEEEALHAFDLEEAPLLRARLIRLDRRHSILLFNTHQVIADGWSFGVLVDELATVYDALASGEAPSLAPLPIQYGDFARWQRQWRSSPDIAAQLAYWRERLRDAPVMRLAKPRRKKPLDDFRTARRSWALPADLVEAARGLSHEEGGTLFMGLVAALNVLLHRAVQQDDVLVATNVANRNRPGTEGLIGPLANTVILRTDLAGDPSSREVIRRARAAALAAFARQDLPFEELADTLQREDASAGVIPKIMILLQNASLRPIAAGARKLAFEEANPDMLMPLVTITTFDVILMLSENSDGLGGTCVYKPHLFSSSTIDRLLRAFRRVLEQMAKHPGRPISTIRISGNEKRSSAYLRA